MIPERRINEKASLGHRNPTQKIKRAGTKRIMTALALAVLIAGVLKVGSVPAAQDLKGAPERRSDAAVQTLAKEVGLLGWILFDAATERGDRDLFVVRPDGSDRRRITNTPGFTEFGARLSPDGSRMMYRRLEGNKSPNHDAWGTQGVLVVADTNGSNPIPQGEEGEYPWASWSPDGKRIACLYKTEGEIRILDFKSKKVLRKLPSKGIFQQLFWSPDGRRLCGTANIAGHDWNIVSMDIETTDLKLLSRVLNCTPDWFKTSDRVVYSHRNPDLTVAKQTMLMQATADGKTRTLIYAEYGRHIYFGCTSPDDRYVIFARPEEDGGFGPMAIVRLADTPIVARGPAYEVLKDMYPAVTDGPVLHLPDVVGFEPYWTDETIIDD